MRNSFSLVFQVVKTPVARAGACCCPGTEGCPESAPVVGWTMPLPRCRRISVRAPVVCQTLSSVAATVRRRPSGRWPPGARSGCSVLPRQPVAQVQKDRCAGLGDGRGIDVVVVVVGCKRSAVCRLPSASAVGRRPASQAEGAGRGVCNCGWEGGSWIVSVTNPSDGRGSCGCRLIGIGKSRLGRQCRTRTTPAPRPGRITGVGGLLVRHRRVRVTREPCLPAST